MRVPTINANPGVEGWNLSWAGLDAHGRLSCLRAKWIVDFWAEGGGALGGGWVFVRTTLLSTLIPPFKLPPDQ